MGSATPNPTPVTHYCLGFLFSFDGSHPEVVLIRKNRPAWQAGKLNGVGGKLEGAETPEQAMRREFFEEAGVEITDWKPVAEMAFHDAVVHVFASKSPEILRVLSMTDEPIDIVDVRRSWDVVPNLRWLLPMAQSALLYKTFKPVYIEEKS